MPKIKNLSAKEIVGATATAATTNNDSIHGSNLPTLRWNDYYSNSLNNNNSINSTNERHSPVRS